MDINVEDIEETLRKETERTLVNDIKTNVQRFVELFYVIVEKNMPQRNSISNPEEVQFGKYRL